MTPSMLRQLWSLVENTQANLLLGLDDPTLVDWLLAQLNQEKSLNNQESDLFSDYIRSRIALIRELAQQRA
jgi:hypothetical protein